MVIKVPCKPDSAIYTLQVESEQAVLAFTAAGTPVMEDTASGSQQLTSSVPLSLLEAQEPWLCSLWSLQHDTQP